MNDTNHKTLNDLMVEHWDSLSEAEKNELVASNKAFPNLVAIIKPGDDETLEQAAIRVMAKYNEVTKPEPRVIIDGITPRDLAKVAIVALYAIVIMVCAILVTR